jgi:hypothetical protein
MKRLVIAERLVHALQALDVAQDWETAWQQVECLVHEYMALPGLG